MKNNKEVKISYWAAHLTTTVSVTLVLLLIGIIALISLSAATETRRLREKLEISVVLGDTIPDSRAIEIAADIRRQPWALDVSTISRKEALTRWKEDTGEDLEAIFGVNPLSPEICFSVKANYTSSDSLKKIGAALTPLPGVANVVLPDTEMVTSMNRNIERLTLVLAVIALVMTIISFVLINNTVHLAIYARRFTIHTMQLVGATDGFIRRPFVSGHMMAGMMAGLIAAAILALALLAAPHGGFNDVATYISWPEYAVVAGGMILLGILLCSLAAWIATSRHLHREYSDLFR